MQGGGLQERALINQTLKFINQFAKVLNDENDDNNDSDADTDDIDSGSSDIDQVEEDEDDDDEEVQVIDETEETNDGVYLKVMGLSEDIGASRVALMYHHFNHLVGEKDLHSILEWSLKLGNCLWCPLVELEQDQIAQMLERVSLRTSILLDIIFEEHIGSNSLQS